MGETLAGQETSLLGTLEEISRLVISHTEDPAETLTNIAQLIHRRFRSYDTSTIQVFFRGGRRPLSLVVSDARIQHEALLQAERLRVVRMTMRTVHDIVNNCLNQLQLLRLEAEGHVPDETLGLFDQAIAVAAAELKSLGDAKAFTEKQLEIGTGLDWAR
jgi:hypothetical protein